MIFGANKKQIEDAYQKKYIEYIQYTKLNPNVSSEELSALKAELKYLEDQLTKIRGGNEKKREAELTNKKQRKDDKNIRNYEALKLKYKPISNLSIAFNHMNKSILYYQSASITREYEQDKVKVRAA